MPNSQLTELLKKHPYLQPVVDRVNRELVPLLESSQLTEDEFEDLALDMLDEINVESLTKSARQKDMAVKAFKTFIELAKMAM